MLDEEVKQILDQINNRFNNIFNDYGVHFRTNLLKDFQYGDSFEQKILCERYMVHNEFLIRRIQDPGFRLYLMKKISFDNKFKSELEEFLRYLFSDIVGYSENQLFKSSILKPSECRNKYEFNGRELNEIYLNRYAKNSLNLIMNKQIESDLNFYYNQLHNITDSSEIDDLKRLALESLIQEHSSMIFLGPDKLFRPLGTIHHPYPSENFNYRFYYEKFNFMEISSKLEPKMTPIGADLIHTKPAFFSQANKILMSSRKVIDFIGSLSGINNIKRDCLTAIIVTDNLYRRNYITRVGTVLEIIWFNSRNLDERIKILNDLYPLSISKEDLKKSLTLSEGLFQKEEIYFKYSRLALHLCKLGYYEEALRLNKSLSDYAINAYHHYAELANTAVSLREMGKYEEAAQNYKRALKGLFRQGKNTHYYIERKNYAECLYYIGRKKRALSILSDVESYVDSAPIENKFRLLYNLACAYRRLGLYEEEYRLLYQALKIGDASDSLAYAKAQERLIEELGRSIILPSGKLDINRLNEYEQDSKFNNLLERASDQYKSFQFHLTEKLLLNALEIKPGNDLAFHGLITIYHLCKDYKKLESTLSYIEEYGIENVNLEVYKGLLPLNNNNLELAREKFKQLITKYWVDLKDKHNMNNFFKFIVETLLRLGHVKRFREHFVQIFEEVDEYVNIVKLANSLGSKLTYYGCFEEAEFFLNLALEREAMNEATLELLGLNYYQKHDYQKAITYYKIISDVSPTNHRCQYNMAESYLNLGDIELAKDCIEKAIELKNQAQYRTFKGLLEEIWNNNLNLERVTNEDVRMMLRSSEANIVLASSKAESLFDFSSIVMGYSTAVERILHDEITLPSVNKVLRKYSKNLKTILSKYRQTPDFNIDRKVFNAILLQNRSISLGSWFYVINTIQNGDISNNPVVDELINYMSSSVTNEQRKLVVKLCNLIKDDRNDAGHIKVIPKDAALNFRKKITALLNELISAFY